MSGEALVFDDSGLALQGEQRKIRLACAAAEEQGLPVISITTAVPSTLFPRPR
jgi:DNA-binding MurR/RpiR family transcriptional regulator